MEFVLNKNFVCKRFVVEIQSKSKMYCPNTDLKKEEEDQPRTLAIVSENLYFDKS